MSGLIVHEWLEPHGGAEKVVDELISLFPHAGLVALWNDAPERFDPKRVTETWLSRTPLRSNKALALPFMLQAWRSLPAFETDWLLCSSHLFAHHARLRSNPGLKKFVYAYTPARYIWNPELDQRGSSFAAKAMSGPLRSIDRRRAQEATSIAAISHFVQERIQDHWGRDCEVIYPPVEVGYFSESKFDQLTAEEQVFLGGLPDTYVLGASRFIPYKRLDDVIRFGSVAGVPVVLAGGGPEEQHLRSLATESGVPVLFVSNPSQALLRELYVRALVYVFPPVEDFGIMPVEAMATGTPIVASRRGGAAETVDPGRTGFLLEAFSPAEIRSAIENLGSIRSENCVTQATKFDRSVFHRDILSWVTA